MKRVLSFITLVILSLLIVSCNIFESDDVDGRIIIDNNDNNFGGRIATTNEEIQLDSSGGVLGKARVAIVPADFRLILRAEVSPPVYEGFTLRASHVSIHDDMAYVTYNREGADYLGGVEIFDVSDVENPVLVSQAIYTDTDISSVAFDNNKLYLAGAINPDLNAVKSPAILERMNLNLMGELTSNTETYDISSYVATDVVAFDDMVLATSGSDGDLLYFEKNSMDSLGAYPVNDARSVSVSDDYVTFLSASPAKLYVANRAQSNAINTYTLAGETIPGSKSTMAIDGEYGYVALNDAGLKVVRLSDGAVLQEIPRPETPAGAIDADCVTNGVSVNEDLVFIANGAAGVFVGKKYDGEDIEIYGTAEFGSSTNFVESKDDVVFVATGYGGLKILEIQRNGFADSELVTTPGSAKFTSKYAAARFKSFSNTNRTEVYVGVDDIAKGSNRSEADFNWTVPGEYVIKFTYDPDDHTLGASIDGNALDISYDAEAPLDAINTLQLDVIGQTKSAGVVLKNVYINGRPVGTFEGNGWKTCHFSGLDVSEGFELYGILELTGDFGSSNENDKINMLLGYVAPESSGDDDDDDDGIDEWAINGQTYQVGDRVMHEGVLYVCLQTHSTYGDPNWAPGIAHSLWERVEDEPSIESRDGGAVFDDKYAQVRYKSFANSGSNEHYLGHADLGSGANRVEEGYTWSNPGTHTIEFTYDPETRTVSSSIDSDGSELSYVVPEDPEGTLNTIQLDVVQRSNGCTVNVKDLTIDGVVVGDYEGDGWKSYTLTGMDFSDGLTLTATIELSGSFSNSSEKDKVDISFGYVAGN